MNKSQLRQLIREEIKRISLGRLLKEDANSILKLLKNNQKEVARKTMNTKHFPFDAIETDTLGDASIVLKDEAGGMSFRYPQDVDKDFVGENGDKPKPITIGGVKLMYVGYNI